MLSPHNHLVKAGRVSTSIVSIVASVWHWRVLVKSLAVRELRARYAGSTLGGAWAVLEPAVQFALYLVVFGYFLGTRLEGSNDVSSFGMYLVSGLVPFQALQESLIRATGLMRANAGLVRHVNVPVEVLLAGSLGAILVRHTITLSLVLIAAIAFGSFSWVQLPWLGVGVTLLIIGCWGFALALVPAGAFLADLSQVVGTGLMILFFMTPIVYPASMWPRAVAPYLALNPLVGLTEAFRAVVVGLPVQPLRVALTAGVAAAAVALGSALFTRRTRAARDVV